MTHYWYYIAAGNILDETTRFFRVKVGHGAQADRDFLWLTAYATNHGHYFELVSDSSTQFVDRCQMSLSEFADCSLERLISARDLVRHFKAGSLPDLPPSQLRTHAHMMRYLNLDYRVGRR